MSLIHLKSSISKITSESSRERFEVTRDSNQRHIQLFGAEETIGELFLGTSPGYRRVHARAGGADEVYSIDFSTFEVPVGKDDWLDKDLLRPLGEVTEVVRDGAWSLSRGEEGWLLGAVLAGIIGVLAVRYGKDKAKQLAEGWVAPPWVARRVLSEAKIARTREQFRAKINEQLVQQCTTLHAEFQKRIIEIADQQIEALSEITQL